MNNDHVIEAALGYYINPLVTVALGVGLLGERLRRMQVVALGFGAGAVVVLTVAYGRVPWIALVLACSFGGYSFLKKSVPVGAVTSLAVETLVLLPAAAVGLVALAAAGESAFLHGSVGRDAAAGRPGRGHRRAAAAVRHRGPPHPADAARPAPVPHPDAAADLCGVAVFHEPLPPARLAGLRARVGGAGGAGRRRRWASAGAPSPSRWPSRREPPA